LFQEADLVPIHPHVVFELPGSFNMLIHILIYAAGTALTALGGFHGYRYCGGRFSKEEETARLRDEFVFGDDLDKMYNEDRIRLDGDEAYKRALGSKPNAVSTPADQRIDDGAPVGDSQSPIKKIEF
jgi:hypothetical protein